MRDRKTDILARWEVRARRRTNERLNRLYLRDSIPKLLDEFAGDLAGAQSDVASVATTHAQQRLHIGYEISQLIGEYIDLREAVHEVFEGDAVTERELSALIDRAIMHAIDRFDRARERKLRVFEQVSSEPMRASNLDELLELLLGVMTEVAPEIDTVTILLREGDALHARASRGLEQEIQRGFSIAIGEGFAGTIAATKRPIFLSDASSDPLVKSDVLHQRGLKALYGVPLVDDDGEVIGVAHMGSTRAFELQEEDLILFRGLCNRATHLIMSRRTADRLQSDEIQRERFIAMLGHDLRTPLQAILGSVQVVLQRGNVAENDRRALERVARASARMSRLVSDLLDFTRARIGHRLPLTLARVDVADVARDMLDEQRDGANVRLTVHEHPTICCDRERIDQVVANLVGNAVRHGAAGAPVDVVIGAANGELALSVHNEGAIPPELLPHVFEPFRSGAHSQGIGLGLFIVEAIVVAHRGSIEVRSSEPEGTTFTVRLPATTAC